MVPSDRGRFVGDVYDSWTGRKVSHGVQTTARWPDDMVSVKFEVEGVSARLDDNYLAIEPEAENDDEAHRLAGAILRRFLAAFSFHHGQFFEASLVQATVGSRLLPEMMQLGKFCMYSLEGTRNAASYAADWIPDLLKNRRLDMALEYFNRAIYLRRSQLEARLNLPFLWGPSSLLGEAFLNYWKCITAILGDPTKEGKRFQSFYKRLGLEQGFMQTDIERLKQIRNDYDVAHSLDIGSSGRLDITDDDLHLAERAAKRVVQAYHDLAAQEPRLD